MNKHKVGILLDEKMRKKVISHEDYRRLKGFALVETSQFFERKSSGWTFSSFSEAKGMKDGSTSGLLTFCKGRLYNQNTSICPDKTCLFILFVI